MWEHHKLTTYRRALDAARDLHAITQRIPEGHADLRDQLRRATTSIVLNIAEGAGEFSPAEKARFYRMARRSCAECASVLDLLRIYEVHVARDIPPSLAQTAALLTLLIKRIDASVARPRRSPEVRP